MTVRISPPDHMEVLLDALSKADLQGFQKSVNKTRRRAIPFSINGKTQWFARDAVKKYVDSLLAR